MHRIEKILRQTKHPDKEGKYYYKTLAVVNGDEVWGWSREKEEFKVGDEVQSFFDDRFHTAKMQKTNFNKEK